jgi:hypothetical protein
MADLTLADVERLEKLRQDVMRHTPTPWTTGAFHIESADRPVAYFSSTRGDAWNEVDNLEWIKDLVNASDALLALAREALERRRDDA